MVWLPGGIIQSNIPAYNWAWSMYVCAKQARPKALNKTISADVLWANRAEQNGASN